MNKSQKFKDNPIKVSFFTKRTNMGDAYGSNRKSMLRTENAERAAMGLPPLPLKEEPPKQPPKPPGPNDNGDRTDKLF